MSTDDDDPGLEQLLAFLHERRGFDFSGYKRPTLRRRIRKRMADVGIEDYATYQDVLEVDSREYTQLFNTILINVTSFFRDRETWDALREDVVPELVAATPDDRPIRVWCAGCASGEEAYTIVMVLAEALGEDEFRRRVKIYATDIDEEALDEARQARYRDDQVEAVPEDLRERYFERAGSGWAFRSDLRRHVIFGRNDLVQDAPISRIDLLVSRNVLMYFTAETQARILERFNFALRPTGHLLLGRSEMLIAHAELFAPRDLKRRIFRAVPRSAATRERSFLVSDLSRSGASGARPDLRDAAASLSPVPQVVVDRAGFVVDLNVRAREDLGLVPADIGRLFQDLDVSYRLGDIRTALDRAYEHGAPTQLRGGTEDDDGQIYDIRVSPVLDGTGRALGAAIAFEDTTALVRLREDYDRSRRDLETAYEELQSTVEELETTNEELQSTNEELETTNEELQSTNEELETMNEELHSTNDELEAMNEQQLEHARELDTANSFLEGILRSLGVGIAVVDRDGRVEIWNSWSEELWGLRPDEVAGRPLVALDFGLPVDRLADQLRRAVNAGAEPSDVTLTAVDRRGRSFPCLVRVLPLSTAHDAHRGALVLMAEARGGELPFTGAPRSV
ncbi:CheR family methyltransferase [Patulibacter sp.]|uniref:CheR family methyltransferase n=1 Tax=Patulibacter sp. TaxID=1912859 RepID=UPI00271A0C31|nr:CheR family methyltransferase [Patulibacter sp.]MDO9409363.1 CheR family methyltransferase [Patulibacter sp.]